ncbi:MAG: 30S ribosomal protein S6, partial [Desulfobacterales bacterium]|nr:30S ribosomal protein S6 [Desulfobacterales bacterium]
MRRYETIVIIDPDLSEEDRKTLLGRIATLISDQDGFLVLEDDWGSRKLAYEIKKRVRGYYVRLDYCGTGALVREMERLFRIDDRILKYMTVQLEELVDVELLKSEMAEAEKKAEEEASKAAEEREAAATDAEPEEKEEAEPEPEPKPE